MAPELCTRQERRDVVRRAAGVGGLQRVDHAAQHDVADDREHRDPLVLDRRADLVTVDPTAGKEDDGAAEREGARAAWYAAVAWTIGVVSSVTSGVRRATKSRAACATSSTVCGTVCPSSAASVREPVVEQRALMPDHALRETRGATGVPEQVVVAGACDARSGS